VLSHPSSGCVLEVEEDRTKESCKKLLTQLAKKSRLFHEGIDFRD